MIEVYTDRYLVPRGRVARHKGRDLREKYPAVRGTLSVERAYARGRARHKGRDLRIGGLRMTVNAGGH